MLYIIDTFKAKERLLKEEGENLGGEEGAGEEVGLKHLWHTLASKAQLIIGQKSLNNARYYKCFLRNSITPPPPHQKTKKKSICSSNFARNIGQFFDFFAR